MKRNNVNEEQLVADYKNYVSVEDLTKIYKIGKLRVKEILANHSIELRHKGFSRIQTESVVKDWKIDKYPPIEGYYYVAVAKDSGKEFIDVKNRAGLLTGYIHDTFGVEIPTLYDRRVYYQKTGNYWWEQWFDIVKRESKITKKCPYCDWKTLDVNNNSGAFEVHLKNIHKITKEDYLKSFPEEIKYFSLVNPTKNLQFETNTDKYVICQVCGKKLTRIDTRHLTKHGLTKEQYLIKYNTPIICVELHDKLSGIAQKVNENMTFKKESSGEKEIKEYLTSWGIETKKNRKILKGKEIDIFIPSHNIGIEYNGNYYHTEWKFGKDRNYHLNKTKICESSGVSLIQIFEDEWVNHKELVLSKIKQSLGLNEGLPKIMGRKCIVSEINKDTAKTFLDTFHIQGFTPSTVYLGAYYNEKLVCVMTFKIESKTSENWELTRYVSDNKYVSQGVASKMFTYFVRKYKPQQVKSFADRRWTIRKENNLYTKLGFKFVGFTSPEYRYYNQKINKFGREHKFNFRKQILHRRFGLPLTMTETEMVKQLGYDRIWDCGMFKYVWYNEDK